MKILSESISDFVDEKGYKLKNNRNSTKLIGNFEKSQFSGVLWNFLRIHPSCRVFFNSIIKGQEKKIEPIIIEENLKKLLKVAKTSPIYIATCKCGAILDRPNIYENNFHLPENKEITCHSCRKKNVIKSKDYVITFEINIDDLTKSLNKAKELKIFSTSIMLECIYCNSPYESIEDIHNVDLECPDCKNPRFVKPIYLFSDDSDIWDFLKEGQGYWLEWYVWKQLQGYEALHSKILENKTTKSQIDVDVCLIKNGQLIIFECKDTSELKDILPNLRYLKKISSKYVLVTTRDVNKKQLAQIKHELGEKFTHITSSKIDNISQSVEKILNI